MKNNKLWFLFMDNMMRDILVKMRYMYSYYIIQFCTIQLGKKWKKRGYRTVALSPGEKKLLNSYIYTFHCFSSLLNLFVFLCPTKTTRVTKRFGSMGPFAPFGRRGGTTISAKILNTGLLFLNRMYQLFNVYRHLLSILYPAFPFILSYDIGWDHQAIIRWWVGCCCSCCCHRHS